MNDTLRADNMSEEALREILAAVGMTWEIDLEINRIGAQTIIAALHGQGDLVAEHGWDANIVEEVLDEAANRGWTVTGYMERIR